MPRFTQIANAVLWAAAILSAALLDAPPMLTAILLPTLAVCAILTNNRSPHCSPLQRGGS
jgi:hypothetical protein